jgi:glutamate-1-semialdehyde aminotransferase
MKSFNISKSNALKERALKVIPHQTGTFSRAASSFVEGVFPAYVESASGSHFTDVDGNVFLDYLLGIGPITLGYNYKPVNDAILEQLQKGILFSLPHPVEVELSELISKTIPHAEMVKFEKSGSNAVTAAVRVARYKTKRDKIAYCGSGGVWHDWQAAMVTRDGGVPDFNKQLIKIFEYNDADGLEQIFEENQNEIAAIVLEPTVYEEPTNNFLNNVRKIADKNNSLLILDEIVTGFRFDLGGAQKRFEVKGDLVCFGKGMGNGLPITAITGPSEFMKLFDDLWVSSTNNSEAFSLAGTIATIDEMRSKKTIDYCWKIGRILFDGWNKISSNYNLNAMMKGYPIRMKLECFDSQKNSSNDLKALIIQEMVKRGIFMSPGVTFLSFSHTPEDIQFTLQCFDEICKDISEKITNDNYSNYLLGKPPQTIWSMKIPPTKKPAN